MKKLFIYFSLFLFLFSCKKNDSGLKAQEPDAEVTQVLVKFYSQYGRSGKALYNQPVAHGLFTPQIRKEIEEIVKASKEDIERIKKSAHPEDKPLLLEGSVFTSLYEGYTKYQIGPVEIRTIKPNIRTADAVIEFKNTDVAPKMAWREKVHLINTSGAGWEIDNITFDKIAQVKDLKTKLNDLRAEFRK
ncbi:hypothetical protein [Chryseobacterium hagamense]|uniref:DUF3828 domain-containing protein n=1 Tax=Chryseobacterium hagamense TaxID=395935 RepID=A0A511YHK9_9FLAO|nr:hypothetical protein [Chryseobacterium hagamense]GEN74685.1 hypothetical protein CHA01nite_04250 [Chryseobacterium hagamense]